MKTFVRVPVSAGAGLKRFCALLCKELTAQAGVKINVKQVDSLPKNLTRNSLDDFYSNRRNDVKREKQEKQWGWVDKSQNNTSSERKNFERDNRDSNFENSDHYREEKFENDSRRNFSNNFRNEYRKKQPGFFITQVSKPIIYYDPTNPDHKCYELNSDDEQEEQIEEPSKEATESQEIVPSIEEKTEEKLPAEKLTSKNTFQAEDITDFGQTENLKSALAETNDQSSAGVFSFGFSRTDDNQIEKEFSSPEKLPQVDKIKEGKAKKSKLLFTLPSLEEMKSVSFFNPKSSAQIEAESKAAAGQKKLDKNSINKRKNYENYKKHKNGKSNDVELAK